MKQMGNGLIEATDVNTVNTIFWIIIAIKVVNDK